MAVLALKTCHNYFTNYNLINVINFNIFNSMCACVYACICVCEHACVRGLMSAGVQSITHQIVHLGLSTALISMALALISNYKCIS
jgi:hypothetical protein